MAEAVSSELIPPASDVAAAKGRGFELIIDDRSTVEDGIVVGS
jgi:hypothetical protein